MVKISFGINFYLEFEDEKWRELYFVVIFGE